MPIKQRELVSVPKPKPKPQTFAPIKPKDPSLFVLQPHPYVIDEGVTGIDTWAVDCFHKLLSDTFNKPVPAYRVCEYFDIHRCVLAEWITALNKVKNNLRFSNTPLPEIDLAPASFYDPWMDRKYDKYMSSYLSCFPWLVIDKYYLITSDEVLTHTGEARSRPNGDPFRPVTYNQAYRIFNNREGWKRENWPQERYRELCEAATGQRGIKASVGLKRRVTDPIDQLEKHRQAEAARVEAQTEERIDRLGIRGHVWLEGFIRQSPWTEDEYFTKALHEEDQRYKAEARWQKTLKLNPNIKKFITPRKISKPSNIKPRPRPKNT